MPSSKKRKTPFWKRTWIVAIFLAVGSALIYDPWRFENTSGDTISTRYWPVCILKYGTGLMNPFKKDLEGVNYAAIKSLDGKTWWARNGLAMSIFTVPLYAIADQLNILGPQWDHYRINQFSRWNAIFLASLTVALMYLFLLKIVSPGTGLFSTLIFAFGTWNFSLGAQGLSSQTAAVLVHVLVLFSIWNLCRAEHIRLSSFLLGLYSGIQFGLRPPDTVLLMPFVLLPWARRSMVPYLLGVFAIGVPVIGYNYAWYGFATGFYGVLQYNSNTPTLRMNFLSGLLGLLFSPNKGAIIFCPLLFFVPFAWRTGAFESPIRSFCRIQIKSLLFRKKTPAASEMFYGITVFSCAGYLLYISFVPFWHTTWSFGSRYLYDLQPYYWPSLTLFFGKAWEQLKSKWSWKRQWTTALAFLFCVQSVFIHFLGHRNYDLFVWNYKYVSMQDADAWNFRDLMLLDVWRAGSNRHRWDDYLKRIRDYGF